MACCNLERALDEPTVLVVGRSCIAITKLSNQTITWFKNTGHVLRFSDSDLSHTPRYKWLFDWPRYICRCPTCSYGRQYKL